MALTVQGKLLAKARPSGFAWVRTVANCFMGIVFGLGTLAHVPGLMKSPAPHFEWLCQIVPPQIPGSAEFHVLWTGVAEIIVSMWMLSTGSPASAKAGFVLLMLVSPAHYHHYVEDIPAPNGTPISFNMHATRWAIQVLFAMALWYLGWGGSQAKGGQKDGAKKKNE